MANGTVRITRGPLHLPDCHGRPACDPVPVCPACGGLECLCRPRFFAGQLLTEEDLNRLDHYMQAKNRLHNRHLHGWGVSCGLEVVCGVCEPDQRTVLVKPGYALSPCGNDIVVCRTETVDICDLVQRCRPPGDECYDLVAPPPVERAPAPPTGLTALPPAMTNVPGTPPPMTSDAPNEPRPTIADCGEGTEQWVLAICYTEKASRGVAALRASVCDCGCGCGGHDTHAHGNGAGGCGCTNGSTGRRKAGRPAAKTPRSVPEQCEPTVTCEGYRFVVYKKPKERNRDQYGAAARRFLCCVQPLFEELDAIEGGMTAAEAQQWLLSFRDSVREFLVNEGLYDCEIARRLAAIVIPDVGGQPTGTAMTELDKVAGTITAVAAVVLQKCLCAALLPPCPEPSQTDCVPIATVTVKRDTCRVLRVCNLSARKFLITIPNLGYWLSFMNIFAGSGKTAGQSLRAVLERLCCRPFGQIDDRVKGAKYFREGAGAQPLGVEARTRVKGDTPFGSLLWNAMARPERPVGVEHVLAGLLDARDADGRPFLSEDELAHPSELLMLNHVVAPILRTMVPLGSAAEAVSGLGLGPGGAADAGDVKNELASLKEVVEAQRRRIDELERRG